MTIMPIVTVLLMIAGGCLWSIGFSNMKLAGSDEHIDQLFKHMRLTLWLRGVAAIIAMILAAVLTLLHLGLL